jgi:hypothetical protein
LKGLAGTSIPLSTIRRALAFSTTAELTIRGGGKPYSNLALDADRENGPAARSFAADAHDCIMVRIKDPTAYKSVARRCAPMASSPRILNRQTGTVQTLKLCKKSPKNPTMIRTVRGRGYIFMPEVELS